MLGRFYVNLMNLFHKKKFKIYLHEKAVDYSLLGAFKFQNYALLFSSFTVKIHIVRDRFTILTFCLINIV